MLTEKLLTLPQIVRELVGAQHRTEERVDQLIQHVGRLVEAQLRMGTEVERLKGSDLERRYRERGHAYFSPLGPAGPRPVRG